MTHASYARQLTARTKTANVMDSDTMAVAVDRRDGPACIEDRPYGRPRRSSPWPWRGWRKRHRGVDQAGVIRVHTLTEETGDDATMAIDRLTAVKGPLARVTADAASDTVAIDETARARGATVVVPTGQAGDRLWPRLAVARTGSNDPVGQDARPVPLEAGIRVPSSGPGGEHVLPRHVIIGEGLRARSPARQGSAVVLGCEILNRMTALGRLVSSRLGR